MVGCSCCSCILEWGWSHPPDSNRRPTDYESVALPSELGWPGQDCDRGEEANLTAGRMCRQARPSSFPDGRGHDGKSVVFRRGGSVRGGASGYCVPQTLQQAFQLALQTRNPVRQRPHVAVQRPQEHQNRRDAADDDILRRNHALTP